MVFKNALNNVLHIRAKKTKPPLSGRLCKIVCFKKPKPAFRKTGTQACNFTGFSWITFIQLSILIMT